MKGTLKRICTARALLLAMIVISSLVAFAILCTHLYERMQQPYGSYNWSRKAIDDSIISGNNIIDLLYKYRDDNKVFPQNLTDLIPKYCSCIEMPKAGDKIWFYERDPNDNGFFIMFSCRHMYPSCSYSSSYPEWRLDE